MALMSGELYDALLEGGTSEEKARKAAEAVASYDNRCAVIDTRLVELTGRVTMLQWMVGTVLLVVLGVLWKVIKL